MEPQEVQLVVVLVLAAQRAFLRHHLVWVLQTWTSGFHRPELARLVVAVLFVVVLAEFPAALPSVAALLEKLPALALILAAVVV